MESNFASVYIARKQNSKEKTMLFYSLDKTEDKNTLADNVQNQLCFEQWGTAVT